MKLSGKAGWAEIDITPPLGLPMGGRGPRYAPGNEILDPLMAHALVLEDSNGKAILILSLDLIGFSFSRSSALRFELTALTGVPYNAIVINYAHTHSGPMVNFEKYPGKVDEPADLLAYHDTLRRKIFTVVKNALANLQPVTAHIHNGFSRVGINRRRKTESGDIVLAPNPDGYVNPDLWVLDIQAITGKERCVALSYGCHPVIVYGYKWQGISADYPGACRIALKQQLGENLHCQFFQGLAGNIRPRILADMPAGVFRKASGDDHVKAGKELAEDTLGALHAPGNLLKLELETKTDWVPALRDSSKILPLREWQAMALSEDELTRNVGQYWTERMVNGPPLARVSPMEVGVVHLDELHAIAWVSAEAVSEWLPLIRQSNPAKNIFVWGYSQFVPTYLPTDALLSEGGYEVINANMYEVNGPGPFAPGLDKAFTSVFRKLLK